MLIRGDVAELERAHRLGFRSVEWIGFHEGPASIGHSDWKPYAERLAATAQARDVRISAIGALYANPLDPRQSDTARATFRRAIEVAAHLGIRTVAGFPGAVIELDAHPTGGNPVYRPFENYLPQLLAFWEPLAREAADRGVRLAFEHCPQGPYHLPIMHYNMLGQPAMWERLFNATACENLGLEWDPSHLLCQLIDPVANIHKFGRKIFHVHAKDAYIDRALLEQYGLCHWGVAEHRFPGLGQANWAEIVHALVRAEYDSDLNIEGWHDPVFRGHGDGRNLEEAGLLIAQRTLEQYVGSRLPPDSG
jgi:sugar phosphate isomerase/epimerase